jgi:hypothetical protein
LVSGFDIAYGDGVFALIFWASMPHVISTGEKGFTFDVITNYTVNILGQLSIHMESFNHDTNNDIELHNFPHKPV